MRRSRRALLFVILVAIGAAPAIAAPLALGGAARSAWTEPSAMVGAVAVVASLGLDAAGVTPVSVRRQVPQPWGHRRGPWLGALRYAPRLGFGPATILTSWLWWAGLLVGALGGTAAAIGFGASYVLIRSVATVVIGSGVREGVAMAHRMARIIGARVPVQRAVSVVAFGVAALLGWAGRP